MRDNIPESKDNDENKGDKRDAATVRREDFLNIYKENGDEGEQNGDGVDLSNGIRFKRDEEENGFDLKTSVNDGKSPLIQELDVTDSVASTTASQKSAPKKEKEIPFDFETAERVELKTNFIQQNELVFLNINAKGYKKDEDVRYAL